MTSPTTRPELISAMRDATKTALTGEELFRQRVSYVMGSLKPESGVTRARIEDVLGRQEGRVSDTVRVNGQ